MRLNPTTERDTPVLRHGAKEQDDNDRFHRLALRIEAAEDKVAKEKVLEGELAKDQNDRFESLVLRVKAVEDEVAKEKQQTTLQPHQPRQGEIRQCKTRQNEMRQDNMVLSCVVLCYLVFVLRCLPCAVAYLSRYAFLVLSCICLVMPSLCYLVFVL
jgi:hypothetical protein